MAKDTLTAWQVFPWFAASTGLVALVALVGLRPASLSFWQDAIFDKGTPFVYPSQSQACCDVLVALAALSLLASVVHVVRSLALRGASSISAAGTPLSISLEFTSQVVVSPILFALYASGGFALNGTLASRWTGATRNTYTGVVIHTAMDLLGTVLFIGLGKEPLLFLHHALTLTVFGTAALTGFGHYYSALGGLVELTNLFTFAIASGPAVGISPGSALHTASGALLWISFTILRMGMHPYNLACYAHDAFSHPEATILLHPPSLRFSGGPAYVAILLMSMLWYAKITKGLLKALGFSKTSKGDSAKQE